MADLATFASGDVVVHPRKPEWGEGVVDQATRIVHDGRDAQRLIVRFANQGRVTINTGIAPLVSKAAEMSTLKSFQPNPVIPAGPPPADDGTPSPGWLESLATRSRNDAAELWRLPDEFTDPFAPLNKRLQATLDSYRFNNHRDARLLLEWACRQTGLSDPLTRYTRHELEQAFPRFARDRDAQLADLVRMIKRQGRGDILAEITPTLSSPAKSALERALRA